MGHDFVMIDQGSIIMLVLFTDEAKEWFDENVDCPDHMWMGPNPCIERRYAYDIVVAMEDAGLEYGR